MAAPQEFKSVGTRPLPPNKGSAGGRYMLRMRSGLLTLVAAKTASAGHVATLRNPSASGKHVLLERLAIEAGPVTDFTALQRLGFAAFVARAFTSAYTGGTGQTLTGNNAKKRTSDPTTVVEARMATTGELTQVAATLDAQPFMGAEGGVPADAATAENKILRGVWSEVESGAPIILAPDEGIVVANMVLMGAAGTVALQIDAEWRELDSDEVDARY